MNKRYQHIAALERHIHQLENRMLTSQSSVPGVEQTQLSDNATQGITAFADQDAGWTTTIGSSYEPTMDISTNSDSDIGQFLSRPIRESAQSWRVGHTLFHKFNPWSAFCQNKFVRDKIKNYELLRLKLHCKVVVSGTQFHYGRAIMSYNPYTLGDQTTVEREVQDNDLIAASQRPHVFINPAKNEGGELHLPFFYPDNYLEIPKADWSDMGDIYIHSFGNLQHANAGNDAVNVTIYLWATDVVLTMPTISDPPLKSQSGRRAKKSLSDRDSSNKLGADEYGTGIISKPAAAIAKAAGELSSIPAIGPYMVATQIASGAAANIARMFGYSRPSVLTDIGLYKPTPTGNLANVDAADAVQKLTLDSKAELTVDSRTVGLDGTDQMGIVDYACRESYLTRFAWAPTNQTDDLLWGTRVLPMNIGVNQKEIHLTPLAHIATAFEQWTGSIKYRFQIVKTNFHKGRLLVRWDPNAFASAVNYNVSYSRVVDIADTDDFEIVIGWGQSTPWKECGQPGSENFSINRLSENVKEGNGVLEVLVLNELVSPAADSNIAINVFVSACDDIKFAGPTNEKIRKYSFFKEFSTSQGHQAPVISGGTSSHTRSLPLHSQSGKLESEQGILPSADAPVGAESLETIGKETAQDDNTYIVYYGDPPTSLRELFKRYCYVRTWVAPNTATDQLQISELTTKNFPFYVGWDPKGIYGNKGNTHKVTMGGSHFLNWFTPCYAGCRGSIRKKYLFENAGSTSPLVTRGTFEHIQGAHWSHHEISYSETPETQEKFLSSRWCPQSGAGCANTNCEINNTIEVEFPYYYPKRFSAARTIQAADLQSNSHTVRIISDVKASGPTNFPRFQEFVAAGEDFSLFFFTGVPIIYKYTLQETA